MKQILLIILGLSVTVYANFTRDNSTQIVIDNSTMLQWQDNSDASSATKTWIEAIDYCEALTLAMYTDWRLPNFNELYYISDRSKHDPTMDDEFQNVASDYYWSSTTVLGDEGNAWIVSFYSGYGNWYYKPKNANVRCVRDGQP